MHNKRVKYLVLIESAGAMVARLFAADRAYLGDFDASSEEVAVMTAGVMPLRGAQGPEWGRGLAGHSVPEKAAALVFELDV